MSAAKSRSRGLTGFVAQDPHHGDRRDGWADRLCLALSKAQGAGRSVAIVYFKKSLNGAAVL
jgi:hypothetical protein